MVNVLFVTSLLQRYQSNFIGWKERRHFRAGCIK